MGVSNELGISGSDCNGSGRAHGSQRNLGAEQEL